MVQIIRICDCIWVLFGWFYYRSMFFVFHGVFEGGLEGGCVLVLGCFQYHHTLKELFCYAKCGWILVVCYWFGLLFCFFLWCLGLYLFGKGGMCYGVCMVLWLLFLSFYLWGCLY
jgi:hypothetical protein